MALLGRTLGVLLAAAALLAGCASEEWDNRFDPDSKAYRGPCAGAPAGKAAVCALWEEFDDGLVRWLVGAAPKGQKPIRVLSADPTGKVATVLALPGCPGAAATLQTELTFPVNTLFLSVLWKAADKSQSELKVAVSGEDVGLQNSPSGDPAFAGWTESFASVTRQGSSDAVFALSTRSKGGAACGTDGIYVARVALQKQAD